MSPRITVLYEDKLSSANPKNFGPHLLALACLADRLPRELEALKQLIDGRPFKGVGNVIAACRKSDLGELFPRIVAVCDDDEVRPHLSLAPGACKTQVRRELASGCVWSDRLHPVLLERNLETLLEAVVQVLERAPLAGKPSPLHRDRILSHLVFGGTQEQRRALLERVPSFDYLVTKLERLVIELEL